MNQIANDWDAVLKNEWEQDYYKNLMEFIDEEYKDNVIFPPKEEMFRALELTSYEDTKVVILGQDPYHGEYQSHGLVFSVRPGVKIPPSLRNIFKELESSVDFKLPNNGYLVEWAEQGVLLLNTILTVREGEPHSHRKKGWETLTDEIIKLLNNKKDPVIFLLWGNSAKDKAELITNPKHHILTSSHPSPFSARLSFEGCNHFSEVNNILAKENRKLINWQTKNR